jgi:TRAP-type C4-dicarboxylate transport system permease small subunit
MHWLLRLDQLIGRLEKILVAVLLSAMILLAFGQIVLRNFFGTGFAWSDSLVRYLVLWVAFLGATMAAGENRHIRIELLPGRSGTRSRTFLGVVSLTLSILVCSLLTWAAARFVQFEAQMGASTFLGLPAWFPAVIIPVTFAVITFRYLLRLILEIKSSLLQAPGEPEY